MEMELALVSGEKLAKVHCPLMASPHDVAMEVGVFIRILDPTRFDVALEGAPRVRILKGTDLINSNEAEFATMGEAIFGPKSFLFCVPKGDRASPRDAIETYRFNSFVVEYKP
jgi:hypothetical protein